MIWAVVVRAGESGLFEVMKDYGDVVVGREGYKVLGRWKYEEEMESQLWQYLDRVSVVEYGVVRRSNNVYDVVNGINQFLLMVR